MYILVTYLSLFESPVCLPMDSVCVMRDAWGWCCACCKSLVFVTTLLASPFALFCFYFFTPTIVLCWIGIVTITCFNVANLVVVAYFMLYRSTTLSNVIGSTILILMLNVLSTVNTLAIYFRNKTFDLHNLNHTPLTLQIFLWIMVVTSALQIVTLICTSTCYMYHKNRLNVYEPIDIDM